MRLTSKQTNVALEAPLDPSSVKRNTVTPITSTSVLNSQEKISWAGLFATTQAETAALTRRACCTYQRPVEVLI